MEIQNVVIGIEQRPMMKFLQGFVMITSGRLHMEIVNYIMWVSPL